MLLYRENFDPVFYRRRFDYDFVIVVYGIERHCVRRNPESDDLADGIALTVRIRNAPGYGRKLVPGFQSIYAELDGATLYDVAEGVAAGVRIDRDRSAVIIYADSARDNKGYRVQSVLHYVHYLGIGIDLVRGVRQRRSRNRGRQCGLAVHHDFGNVISVRSGHADGSYLAVSYGESAARSQSRFDGIIVFVHHRKIDVIIHIFGGHGNYCVLRYSCDRKCDLRDTVIVFDGQIGNLRRFVESRVVRRRHIIDFVFVYPAISGYVLFVPVVNVHKRAVYPDRGKVFAGIGGHGESNFTALQMLGAGRDVAGIHGKAFVFAAGTCGSIRELYGVIDVFKGYLDILIRSHGFKDKSVFALRRAENVYAVHGYGGYPLLQAGGRNDHGHTAAGSHFEGLRSVVVYAEFSRNHFGSARTAVADDSAAAGYGNADRMVDADEFDPEHKGFGKRQIFGGDTAGEITVLAYAGAVV